MYTEKLKQMEREFIMQQKKLDAVNHHIMQYGRIEGDGLDDAIQPNHYQKNGKDLIDDWQSMFDEQEFRAIIKSNVIKYIVRYENKNGIEDLLKAQEYIKRLIKWEESLDV